MNEEITTINEQQVSFEEAMATLVRLGGHVQVVNARFGMGAFEVEQLTEESRTPQDGRMLTRVGFTHVEMVTQARVEFHTYLVKESEGQNDPAIRIKVSVAILVDYLFDPTATPLDREVFAKAVGVAHAWPFWREFFSSSLARMQIFGPPQGMIGQERAILMAGFVKAKTEQTIAKSATEMKA